MFTAILYDQSSAINTALDTGAVNTLKIGVVDAVLVEVTASAASYTGKVTLYDPDISASSYLLQIATANADTIVNTVGWGAGVGSAAGPTGTKYLGGIPAPIPPNIEVTTEAFSGGTVRIRIIGVNTSGR